MSQVGAGKISDWFEKRAAALSALLPAPPFMGALSEIETKIAADILAKHTSEIEDGKKRYLAQTRSRRTGKTPSASQAADALGEHAARMVAELRARLACVPSDRPVLSIVARMDARLPTDVEEYMDDPTLDPTRRQALISALDRATRRAGDYHLLAGLLDPLCPPRSSSATTVLDLASGPGGFPLALAKIAGRRKNLRIVASDIDPAYLDIGRRRAEREGMLDVVEFVALDAFRLSQADLTVRPDIVTCTRTLHHFGIAKTTKLLLNAVEAAARGILLVDISRSISRLLMAAGAGIASGNWRFAHDAVVSVRKSFTPQELRIVAACIPGGDTLDIFYTAPAYVVVRSRVAPGITREEETSC